MSYRLSFKAADGSVIHLFGFAIDAAKSYGWLLAASAMAAGVATWLYMRQGFKNAWDAAHGEIEDTLQQIQVQA